MRASSSHGARGTGAGLVASLLLASGCASSATATPDTGVDAVTEAALDQGAELRDASADDGDVSLRDATTEPMDTRADAPSPDAADAGDDTGDGAVDAPDGWPDVALPCALDPPSGPPPETRRSCAPGQAPAWHCREVGHCGGEYVVGSTDAWIANNTEGVNARGQRMEICDLHRATTRAGYVDAYEVTVARFRAWVRAGSPRPTNGQYYFGSFRWIDGATRITTPGVATAAEYVPGHPTSSSMCTYTAEPGANEHLPMNCVDLSSALAFCWWEGKHLATEVGWEFVARNRGTTATPFGNVPAGRDGCRFGDVGAYNGLCPMRPLPQRVDAFPLGATRDPPGIFGLYGGVSEFVLGARIPYFDWKQLICRDRYSEPDVDGSRGEYVVRGTAWYQSLEHRESLSHSASRNYGPQTDMRIDRDTRAPRSPRIGFRCMRWVPEPRGP